jgi:putative ABC transport system substrate-binding protein
MRKLKLLFVLLLSACQQDTPKDVKKVFINQFIEHPALNQTTKGIIDGLDINGYKKGINLDLRVESAQGNAALASQISGKFIGQGADVIVGVATVSAQSVTKYAKDKKVSLIFSSVTDPLKANLVQSLKAPGYNTSGVSNFVDIEPQLTLFKKIQPDLKRLGFIYNPSEANSLTLIEKLEKLSKKFEITLVLQSAHKTSDVPQAATKLASTVDAIFVSNDNTALSALQAIISAATKVKIPVYVSDIDAVEQGALAALGPNQYQIGLQTAAMIVRVLKGENAGRIPVEFPSSTELYLNENIAKKIGIIFDDSIKKTATKIIDTQTS